MVVLGTNLCLFCRLLFPEIQDKQEMEAVLQELFYQSRVDETLRPQALTLKQFEHLCDAYTSIVKSGRHVNSTNNNYYVNSTNISDHKAERELNDLLK